MSRRQLVDVARSLGIRTEVVARGKRGAKDNNWLRTEIIERTYGPGMEWKFRSAGEADDQVSVMAACSLGRCGWTLQASQQALRTAAEGLIELRRLRALQRRDSAKEDALARDIRAWLDACRAAQDLAELERDMRAAGYDVSGADRETRAVQMEQYKQHEDRAKQGLAAMGLR